MVPIKLTALCAVLLAVSAGGGGQSPISPDARRSAGLHVTGISFHAWYYDASDDRIEYQEFSRLPVADDQDEYPTFDIVIAVENSGRRLPQKLSAQTTLTYELVPMDAAAATVAGQRAEASPPLPTEHRLERAHSVVTRVPLVEPSGTRRVRVATIDLWGDIEQQWSRGLWPSQAVVEVTVTCTFQDGHVQAVRVRRVLRIGMGC